MSKKEAKKPIFNTDIEQQYNMYLNRLSITADDVPEDYLRETKRAFFGGVAQMLLLYTDMVNTLSPKVFVSKVMGIENQINEFWQEETRKHEAKGS